MPNHPSNPYRAPLNGNDALAILRITWEWIEGKNNGHGYDTDDLIQSLDTGGYDASWIEKS